MKSAFKNIQNSIFGEFFSIGKSSRRDGGAKRPSRPAGRRYAHGHPPRGSLVRAGRKGPAPAAMSTSIGSAGALCDRTSQPGISPGRDTLGARASAERVSRASHAKRPSASRSVHEHRVALYDQASRPAPAISPGWERAGARASAESNEVVSPLSREGETAGRHPLHSWTSLRG